MKIVYLIAFVFLGIWLILSGIIGLAGMQVPMVLGLIMNLLALISGILFLITVGKCYCLCEKCSCESERIERR